MRYAENYSVKFKRDGRQYYFNLGKDKKAAEKTANDIAAFLAVKSHCIEEALQLFAPEKHPAKPKEGEKHVPTVKEFCDRYRESAVHLSRSTIQNNICAVHRITAHILGFNAHGKSMPRNSLKKWRQKVEAMPMSRFCEEQLLSFRTSMIRAAGADEVKRGRAITTNNSYLRCAASTFSRRWRPFFRDFALPEPNPFLDVKPLPEPSHRYDSTIDAVSLVSDAKAELAESDPEAYLVFNLALFCGMRRKEIDRLRWEQIDFKNSHIWIRIGADDEEEVIADGIAIAAKMLDSVERAGKQVTPGNIAYYALQHLKSGRRSTSGSRTDVFACGTQLDGRSVLHSCEEEVGYDPELDEAIRLGDLLACQSDDPADTASRNVD